MNVIPYLHLWRQTLPIQFEGSIDSSVQGPLLPYIEFRIKYRPAELQWSTTVTYTCSIGDCKKIKLLCEVSSAL